MKPLLPLHKKTTPPTSTNLLAHETIYDTSVSAVNDAIASSVNNIIQKLDPKTLTVMREIVPGVIDYGTHFEVDGWKVSKENLGAPTLPKGKIQINPIRAHRRVPQVWSEHTDGETTWLYNEEGARREIEHRGEYPPSPEEFLQVINSVPGNALEKANALNMPRAGCRTAESGKYINKNFAKDVGAYFWTFHENYKDRHDAPCVSLLSENDEAIISLNNRARGQSVRSFLEKKRE